MKESKGQHTASLHRNVRDTDLTLYAVPYASDYLPLFTQPQKMFLILQNRQSFADLKTSPDNQILF